MSLLRTEEEAALTELYKCLSENADHYEEFSEFLKDTVYQQELYGIAERRRSLLTRFEELLRKQEILPAAPNEDRKALSSLIDKATAIFSVDEGSEILEQRLVAEQHLARQISDCLKTAQHKVAQDFLNTLVLDVEEVTIHLQRLLRNSVN